MTTQNVDAKEISKFEALAHRWWDPHSEFKPLHDINPLRLRYIQERASLTGKQVLDVGCGGGILTEAMATLGADVLGIDLGDAPLRVAKIHAKESNLNVEYELIAIEELAKKSRHCFDVITCMEMLEHVPDPYSVVSACVKLLRPNGHVFFSTINRNPKSFLFAIIGAEHILKLLPKGTHEYQKFIRPSELSDWVRRAGLNISDVTGMTYNPFTKEYRLSNDVSVNYLAHANLEP